LTTSPKPADLVRLLHATAGLPSGSKGTLIGWYARQPRLALVDFHDDSGPLTVPADAIVGLRENLGT
jgi:hypothetical protein